MKKLFYIFFFLIFMNISLYANSLRIEINDLSKNLSDYKIIDVRNPDKFIIDHIKGAINLPANLTYENKSINGRITEPSKMQNLIRKLGLDINDKIVIYDNGTFFDASRVFWALEVYGFKELKLLNAGYDYWKELNLEISSDFIDIKPSNYISSLDNKKLATKFTTQIATRNNSQVIIDARGYDFYVGDKTSAVRYGHIPKAINIPATENIENDNSVSKLKNISELQKVYKDLNKDKKIIIYCTIGRIASTNYFALRELGYDVSNYDASWNEWGNDLNLPIINLAKKE